MDVNFSPLFSREIATSISLINELIIDVNNELIDYGISTKWAKVGNIDGYYFSIHDPLNKKNEISFGIWNTLWIKSGNPLCLTIDLKTLSSDEIYNKLTAFIKVNNLDNLQIVEINEIFSICFSEDYLINIKYLREITELIIAIIEEFKFEFDISKKKW